MFGRVYLGEIKKIIRPRGLIAVGVILVVAAVIYAVVFGQVVKDEVAFMVSAESFTMLFFDILIAIVVIYGIVLAAGLYADEYKRGTIKMVMLRPVSRNSLTVAKLLALFTYIGGLILSVTLLLFLYGWARYGSQSTVEIPMRFNGTTDYTATFGAQTAIAVFCKVLSIFLYMIVAFCIGTLSKNKILAIVLTIVVQRGVFLLPFMLIDGIAEVELQRFLFSANVDLSAYFGATTSLVSQIAGNEMGGLGGIPKGGNLYIALGALAVYLTVLIVPTFVVVNRRDVV